MGIQFFTPNELKEVLKKRGLSEADLYALAFLPATQKFGKGEAALKVFEDLKWKFSLPPFEFGQWFRFNQSSQIPRAPKMKQDWEIGFVTNAIHEVQRVRYSKGEERVFNPPQPVIDSEDKKSFPFFAKGQGEFGIASFLFEYSESSAVVKQPEQIARHIQELVSIDRAPLLQLWLEDGPSAHVPDSNKEGGRLTQYQRILILKAWIAAMPAGGVVPADGWLAESTPYCVSMVAKIPESSPSTFRLQRPFKLLSFAFSVPDEFRPTELDERKFATAQDKFPGVEFSKVDPKRLQRKPPIISGVTANERFDEWARSNL